MKKLSSYLSAIFLSGVYFLNADVSLPAIFSDHAVLQREIPVKVWGWADPSEKVIVKFVGETVSTQADFNGDWEVSFSAQKAGGPHEMVVKGKNEIRRGDILFGEVWLCSGQSNMGFVVKNSLNGDLVQLKGNDSNLRLITLPNIGTQELQKDFKGSWAQATSETVSNFSAVGYFFGRELRDILDVPIGLINNAWGGSACEAWLPREVLEADARYKPYLEMFDEKVKSYDEEKEMAWYNKKKEAWKLAFKNAKENNTTLPRAPRYPQNPAIGQHRPANLYNGKLNPIIGYGIKGAIWYQGENNTNDNRSYDYRYLLPLMVNTWRDAWGIGDFSFYWSQLADFSKTRDTETASSWGEIRESMTIATHKLKNSGQAVIIDLGEDKDIHPRNKIDVAKRLVRHALAKDYGLEIVCHSPEYKNHKIEGNKVVIEFDFAEAGFRLFDVDEVLGFTIAGEDQKFIEAKAVIKGKSIEVWSDTINAPSAVRYAWASNPICNVYNKAGDLPLTPFRTDDWKLSSQLLD